jgi:hypothetical protein
MNLNNEEYLNPKSIYGMSDINARKKEIEIL